MIIRVAKVLEKLGKQSTDLQKPKKQNNNEVTELRFRM